MKNIDFDNLTDEQLDRIANDFKSINTYIKTTQMAHICKQCEKQFETWQREHECAICEEGTEEIENEFGDGSSWRKCRHCNGQGIYIANETMFCSEGCLIDFMEEQYEY